MRDSFSSSRLSFRSKDVVFELVNHNGLEHLSSFTTENMNQIRSCVIKDCNKIRTIVNGNTGRGSILNKMEQLHMINLLEENLWRSNARSQKLEDFDVKQLSEVDLGMYILCDSTTSTNSSSRIV
ncbi:hypothetical protein Tco_1076416 [Tanacetum coccineum]